MYHIFLLKLEYGLCNWKAKWTNTCDTTQFKQSSFIEGLLTSNDITKPSDKAIVYELCHSKKLQKPPHIF